jgi:hypothetical protein
MIVSRASGAFARSCRMIFKQSMSPCPIAAPIEWVPSGVGHRDRMPEQAGKSTGVHVDRRAARRDIAVVDRGDQPGQRSAGVDRVEDDSLGRCDERHCGGHGFDQVTVAAADLVEAGTAAFLTTGAADCGGWRILECLLQS